MVKWSSGRVKERVQGFWGWPQRPLSDSAGVRVGPAVLAFGLCLLAFDFAVAGWRGVYHDGPVSVHIVPNQKLYHVGDTFRLSITATNTSDRDLLIKRDWKEQLVFYHLLPSSLGPRPSPLAPSSQVEWPGKVLIATWMDSIDVVRLQPNQSYTVNRYVRTWIPEDVSTFQFRLKLVGIKDYGRKFDMWQGIAWSNPITVTVRPQPWRG